MPPCLVETPTEGHVDDVRPLRSLREEKLVYPFEPVLQTLGASLRGEGPQLLGQPEEGFHEEPERKGQARTEKRFGRGSRTKKKTQKRKHKNIRNIKHKMRNT